MSRKSGWQKKGVGNFCQLCVINEALDYILTLTESVYVDCICEHIYVGLRVLLH